jgi:hypothetical protein
MAGKKSIKVRILTTNVLDSRDTETLDGDAEHRLSEFSHAKRASNARREHRTLRPPM